MLRYKIEITRSKHYYHDRVKNGLMALPQVLRPREEYALLTPTAKSHLLRPWLKCPLSRARSKRFRRKAGK